MTWWERLFNKKEKTHEEICRETSPEFIGNIEDHEYWYNPDSPVHWWQKNWISPMRHADDLEIWEVYYMDLASKTWKWQIIRTDLYNSHKVNNRLDPELKGGGDWLVWEDQLGVKS